MGSRGRPVAVEEPQPGWNSGSRWKMAKSWRPRLSRSDSGGEGRDPAWALVCEEPRASAPAQDEGR